MSEYAIVQAAIALAHAEVDVAILTHHTDVPLNSATFHRAIMTRETARARLLVTVHDHEWGDPA